jgi:hypothetical protein
VFEVEDSIASRNNASPRRRAEQLSIEVPKFETWIDTAVIPPESEFGCNEILIAVMGVTGQGKSSFINACTSMKTIAEIADLLENDRYIDGKSIYWRLTVCRITRYKRVKSKSRGESVQSKGLYPHYLSAISMMPSPLSPIHYKSADKSKVIKMTIY